MPYYSIKLSNSPSSTFVSLSPHQPDNSNSYWTFIVLNLLFIKGTLRYNSTKMVHDNVVPSVILYVKTFQSMVGSTIPVIVDAPHIFLNRFKNSHEWALLAPMFSVLSHFCENRVHHKHYQGLALNLILMNLKSTEQATRTIFSLVRPIFLLEANRKFYLFYPSSKDLSAQPPNYLYNRVLRKINT